MTSLSVVEAVDLYYLLYSAGVLLFVAWFARALSRPREGEKSG